MDSAPFAILVGTYGQGHVIAAEIPSWGSSGITHKHQLCLVSRSIQCYFVVSSRVGACSEKVRCLEDYNMFYIQRTRDINTGDNRELYSSKFRAQSNECIILIRSYVPFAWICAIMEKKRFIYSECRTFREQWGYQYFVIESSNKAN